jgi:hypothetical protein
VVGHRSLPVHISNISNLWAGTPVHQAAAPQATRKDPGDTVAPTDAQPGANQVPHPEHAPQPTPPLDGLILRSLLVQPVG